MFAGFLQMLMAHINICLNIASTRRNGSYIGRKLICIWPAVEIIHEIMQIIMSTFWACILFSLIYSSFSCVVLVFVCQDWEHQFLAGFTVRLKIQSSFVTSQFVKNMDNLNAEISGSWGESLLF